MRYKLLFVSILFLFQEVSGQLLTNPDFEGTYTTTAPGWHQITFGINQPPVVSYQREASIVHSGASSQRIEVVSLGDGETMLAQDFDFHAGEIFEGSVWLRSADSMKVLLMFQERIPFYHVPAAFIRKIGPGWEKLSIRGGYRRDISTGDTLIEGRLVIQPLDTGVLFVDDAALLNITDSIYNSAVINNSPIPPSYFGMHVNKLGVHQTFPAVRQGMMRLWDTGTEWSVIEPSPGLLNDPANWNYDATGNSGFAYRLDYYVNWILSNDSNTSILYTMGQTPLWCASGASLPPANISDWQNYVSILGNRFQSRIKYWEVWNEADYSGFYSGSVHDLIVLAQSAYQELTAIDPTNTVLSPNFTSALGLAEYLYEGGSNYADVISWHHYPSHHPEESIAEIIGIRNVMENYGIGTKPLWNTEGAVSFPVNSNLLNYESVASVSRTYITQWLAGVENFNWYCWDIQGGFNSDFVPLSYSANLNQYDSITPSGLAFRETASWLTGAQVVNKSVNNDTWVVEIQRQGGYKGYLVWNTSGMQSFNIPPAWNIQQMRELSGAVVTLVHSAIQINELPVLLENSTLTGIEAWSDDNPGLKLFPNPSMDKISISCTNCNHRLFEIFSITGEKIALPIEFKPIETVLNISRLEKGVYVLKNKSLYQKFIKL